MKQIFRLYFSLMMNQNTGVFIDFDSEMILVNEILKLLFLHGIKFFLSPRIFWLVWPNYHGKSWQHCPPSPLQMNALSSASCGNRRPGERIARYSVVCDMIYIRKHENLHEFTRKMCTTSTLQTLLQPTFARGGGGG